MERYENPVASSITWMEVMVGADNAVAADRQVFLDNFGAIPICIGVLTR